MKIFVLLGILLAAAGAQAYEGPMFPATVWRGETAYVRIPPKFVGEIGCVLSAKLPKGLSVGLYARGDAEGQTLVIRSE